jgi:uncharacterized protein (UPF0548 family)
MFRLRKPNEARLERIRASYGDLPLSYAEIGCSRDTAPPGYVVDNYRVQLGSGPAVFERARQAVRDWRVLRLGWVEPCWPDAPVKEGTLVGTVARVFGLWTVNVSRIVYVVEEEGPVSRYGFAYGTLPGHAECGEERFVVEWRRADDSVWYDLRAVSRPGGWLTWLAYPLTRRLQRRFGRDSMRALVEATK